MIKLWKRLTEKPEQDVTDTEEGVVKLYMSYVRGYKALRYECKRLKRQKKYWKKGKYPQRRRDWLEKQKGKVQVTVSVILNMEEMFPFLKKQSKELGIGEGFNND